MSMSHYSHLNHCLPRNASKAPNKEIAFHRCCVDDIDWLQLSYPAAGALPKACTSKGCFDRTSVSSPIELKRVSFKVDPGQSAKKPKTPTATKMSIPAPAQQSGASDPVLSRGTAAVAAKMDAPASIEFEDMKRAIRKDTLGQPIDTICGHVKGKKASGDETGERPFLYVVGENKAFIDDGNPDSLGTIAYRAICIDPDLRGQDSRQQPNRE
jgi:hypothetical protein